MVNLITDKVVFGQSPNQWKYDSISGLFKHQLHYFSDFTYYFLRVNHEQGLRVQDAVIITHPEDVVVTSLTIMLLENRKKLT